MAGGGIPVIGRLGGVDYGTRRIGLAVSDAGQRIASPAGVLDSRGRPGEDAEKLVAWAERESVIGFVIGLPLNMDGTDSRQTKLSRVIAERLGERGTLPVVHWDERLTSFQADQILASAELGKKRRKSLRDAIAAQVILQSYLDRRRVDERSDEGR